MPVTRGPEATELCPLEKASSPGPGVPSLSSVTGLTVWLRFWKVYAGTSQEERTQLGNCQVLAVFSFIASQPVFHVLLLGVQTCGACSPLGVCWRAREPGHASRRLPGGNEVPDSEELGGQGCRLQGALGLSM